MFFRLVTLSPLQPPSGSSWDSCSILGFIQLPLQQLHIFYSSRPLEEETLIPSSRCFQGNRAPRQEEQNNKQTSQILQSDILKLLLQIMCRHVFVA